MLTHTYRLAASLWFKPPLKRQPGQNAKDDQPRKRDDAICAPHREAEDVNDGASSHTRGVASCVGRSTCRRIRAVPAGAAQQ